MTVFMFSISSICGWGWLLPWILPFLLGLFIGYLLWAQWQKRFDTLTGEYDSHKRKYNSLKNDYDLSMTENDNLISKNTKLDGDIQIFKSHQKEFDSQILEKNSAIELLKSRLSEGADHDTDLHSELAVTKQNAQEANEKLIAMEQRNIDNKIELEKLQKDLKEEKLHASQLEQILQNLDDDVDHYSKSGNVNISNFAAPLGIAASKAPQKEPKANESKGLKTKNSGYPGLKNDNLQIIEGVGPKMESVLKEGNIKNWEALAEVSTGDIQKILDSYGDKYKIIDPEHWVAQAKLASQGKWDELIQFQKDIDVSVEGNSKYENLSMTSKNKFKKFKKDDLKVIEGIGPKISELLQEGGIKTWQELADAPISRLNEILSNAGSRYSLAVPDSWPQQAALAANGKWEELEKLQDSLDGGK